MKAITKALTVMGLGLLISISACKKEAGPTGPAGKDGNANVVLYKFAGNDFSVNSDIAKNVSMSADSFDQYVWLTYLKRDAINTYSIPGYGFTGNSEYRIFFNYDASPVEIYISRASGPGEAYDSIKIVGIQIGKVIGKKDDLPNIDFRDYNAVKAYYGIKE